MSPNRSNNPKRRARWTMAAISLLLVPLFGLLFISRASAHDGLSSVFYFDIFADGSVTGEVQHPIPLLNQEFGFDLDADTSTAPDVETIQDVMLPFNTENLVIVGPDGDPWPITFTDVGVLATENRLYATFDFEVDRIFDEAPRVFKVTYEGIFKDRPGHSGFVVIRTDPQTGVFLNEGDFQSDVLSSGDPSSDVDLDNPNTAKALYGTIRLGMEHIFIGNDHILFLLVLLLPAVMLFSMARTWEAVPTFRAGLWRVLKIASMFTIAHSITLTLGGLQIVELPSRLVETVIALSIIAAALHNVRPIFANKEPLIAFTFGIFHGFGFAGLLSDLGVGRGQRLISLFGFNLGVEIGQAFIITLLFPTIFLMRRTAMYPRLMQIGSAVLASIASVWAIERLFDTTLGVDNFVEKFVRAPRVFVLIAIATTIAFGVRHVEASRGRLRPVAGAKTTAEQTSDDPEPARV